MKKENLSKIYEARQKALMKKAKKAVGEDDAFDEIPEDSKGSIELQDMSRRSKSAPGEEIEGELDDVKDMEAYRRWRRLKQLPILNDEMIQVTSDGGTVNLGWFPGLFASRTNHLPSAERDDLFKKRELYMQMHLKAIQEKMRAYGTNPTRLAVKRAAERKKELGYLKAKKAPLVELFGRMFSTEEVHKIVVEEWGFPASFEDIVDFKRNNLKIIEEKQEIFKKNYSDLRLSQKRSRLEELTYLYNRLNDKIKVTTSREDIRVMKDIIAEIRKEVEGEKITINGKIDLNLEADINQHLQKEVFKEFSLTQIIVGRVASKMRVHSSRIIQGLQNSYYARYNRFLGNEPEDVDWEEISHPTQMGFDFEKIPAQYREREQETADEISKIRTSETSTQVKIASSGLKEALLRKLAENTGKVKTDMFKIEQLTLEQLKDKNKLDKESLKTKK